MGVRVYASRYRRRLKVRAPPLHVPMANFTPAAIVRAFGGCAGHSALAFRSLFAALDAKPHVQAWNNGSRDAVSSVLRSFGTVRSLVVGAYAEASDDLHQLFDCVVDSASKQHWRRIGARSAKEARSYFATTLRRAWGVHFAREFARHRIRRVVFVGAPRRQPGRPLATADGDWPALSAGEFAAHALRVGGAWAGGPPGRR